MLILHFRRSYSDVIAKFEPLITKAESLLDHENQGSAAFILVAESLKVLQNHDPSIFDDGKWQQVRKNVLLRLEKLLVRIYVVEELRNKWIYAAAKQIVDNFTSNSSEFNFSM